jgi:TPR repeat protein
MMIKAALNKILDSEAEETDDSVLEEIPMFIAEGKLDGAQQTRALTLDERANLFLNAMYGSRDFTAEDYAEARAMLLDAMATNFTARPESDLQDLDDPDSSADWETDSEIDDLIAAEVRKVSQNKVTRRSYRVSSNIPHAIDRETRPHFMAQAFHTPRSDRQTSTRASSVRKENSSRGTGLGVFTKIAAAVCFMLMSTAVLYLLFSGSKQNNTFADVPLGQLRGIQSERIQETTSMKRDADGAGVAQRLLDLGNRLIANGDVYGGRLVLAEAADDGSAAAALSLGNSFDPQDGSVKAGSPDLEKAKFWYLRAKQLGEKNAQARLDRLNSLTTPR